MSPENILCATFPLTVENIKAKRDEWISAYQKIANEHPSAEENAEKLIARMEHAFQILMQRQTIGSNGDEANREQTNRQAEEEDTAPDEEFPLGNDRDIRFACDYFSISDMANIQLGYAHEVAPGIYKQCAGNQQIRKAFLHELEGEWKEAEREYVSAEATLNDYAQKDRIRCRIRFCQDRAIKKRTELYEKGISFIEEMNFEGAWELFFKAAELEHPESMAEVGYMLAYGLGVPADIEEAMDYLRRSAALECNYACYILWEMHDDGFHNVTASEAKRWCEDAAKRGDKKALARLEDGFDLRPLSEILLEQVEKGNIDALWYLANEYAAQGDEENALIYYDKALEASQIDALLSMADCLSDSSNKGVFDIEKAEEYYRKAAEQGSEKAIFALGKLALKTTATPFWIQAPNTSNIDESIREQHKTQFAWVLLAAEGKCVEAMTHVAIAYYYGYPCEKNAEQAFLWASRAADFGDIYAMYQIGYFYENAIGCEKDIASAILFYTQAAEAGIFEAMLRLSEIYGTGKDGIPIDTQKANRYRFLSGIGRD